MAVKKILKNIVEVKKLQARASGMGLIEQAIARQTNSKAIAKILANVLGQKEVTKEEQKEAKQILRKEYNIDPREETALGMGYGVGGGGGSSKKVTNKIEELKQIVTGIARAMTEVSKQVETVTDQNNKIMKLVQSKTQDQMGVFDKVMPETPVGMTPSEGGILVPQEKPKAEPVAEPAAPEAPTAVEPVAEPAAPEAPTAVPKSQDVKAQTIIERLMETIREKYPVFKILASEKDKPAAAPDDALMAAEASPTDAPTLKPTSGDGGELQPALQAIAKEKELQSTIEPDELKELLRKALKEAFEDIKKESPEVFKSEGGGGGLIGGIGGMVGGAIASKVGGKLLGKITGKVAGETAVKAGAKGLAKAGLKSVLKKIPLIGGIVGLGLAAQRAMSGDLSGAAMEAASGIAGTIPGVGTAASLAIDAGLAAKDAGAFGGGETPLQEAMPTNSGAEIIDMNRQIQSGAVSVRQTAQGTPIVQRITNNTVLPQSEANKQNIEVGNKENTFNRLLAQDFDHPSTQFTFSM